MADDMSPENKTDSIGKAIDDLRGRTVSPLSVIKARLEKSRLNILRKTIAAADHSYNKQYGRKK